MNVNEGDINEERRVDCHWLSFGLPFPLRLQIHFLTFSLSLSLAVPIPLSFPFGPFVHRACERGVLPRDRPA